MPRLESAAEQRFAPVSVSSVMKEVKACMQDQAWSDEEKKNKNLLEYWYTIDRRRFPTLFTMVDKYLCAPCTTVGVEAAFSGVNATLTDQRKSLAPELVEMMEFISHFELRGERPKKRTRAEIKEARSEHLMNSLVYKRARTDEKVVVVDDKQSSEE